MTAARVLRADFETHSTVELSTKNKDGRGVYIYAQAPATNVWCMAYAFGDEPIRLWKRGEPCPPEIAEHVEAGGLCVAWNAQFERLIWREIMGPRYGWPVPKLEQWHCSMARAFAMALPGSLEGAGAALGIDLQKDAAGRRLALQMAKPRRIEPDGTIVWWDQPDKLERLYAYCMRDVEAEREVDKRTVPLRPSEIALYHLDQRMNDRGVFVDTKLCHAARAVVKRTTEVLDDEMRSVTGGAVSRCSNTGEITTWLRANGLEDVESVRKDAVVDLLIRDDLTPAVRRALEIRQEAGKASVAKIDKMLWTTANDGRMRGNLQYHGAGTGRWAARGAQLQNLPRPSLVKSKTEKDEDEVAVQRQAIDLIHRGDPALIDMIFGPPLTVVSDCIRGMIAAPKGFAVTSGDFAAIEGRGIAWLAGQQDVLDVFASGKDIYQQQAGGIFGIPPDSVGKGPKRQIGKVSILALGYQGGVGAYLAMARTYMLKIGDHFDEIWAVARPEHKEKTLEGWAQRGKSSGVEARTWQAAEVVKVAWRAANPKIVAYWSALEDAAIAAVRNPGTTHAAGSVKFKKAGSFLWCQLPSGRCLCYPYPRVEMVKTPWKDRDGKPVWKPQLLYRYVDQFTKQWSEGPTYGGSLAENVTQAVARDIMAEAMIRATDAGYSLVLTVHDELVSEDPEDFGSAEEFRQLMEVVPGWAKGFPIAASVYRAARYRK